MLTENTSSSATSRGGSPILKRMLRIEWLGQTIASLSWICSVFVYGISSTGDWLQLLAASAWFVANMAALVDSD
ncbi:MAG: hypothetical protein AAF802_13225 [Planctomycetota bacterium]